LGGVMIAALSFTSAGAVAIARKVAPGTAITVGAAGLVLGVLLTLAGIHWVWPGTALVGTVLSGAGFGAAFGGSLRRLMPLAQSHERAAIMSAFLGACYLAFSVPAIVAGRTSTPRQGCCSKSMASTSSSEASGFPNTRSQR
jgi:hypothetical protein